MRRLIDWQTGQDAKHNVYWAGSSLRLIFSWMEEGKELTCSWNKTLSTRVYKQVANLQLTLHNNFTSLFLTRDNSGRTLLSAFCRDKSIHDRAKRRLLLSIDYPFPCAKLLKLWEILENDECRLYKRVTAWQESLGHIQA